jgi:large subunit ribosomal protein L6
MSRIGKKPIPFPPGVEVRAEASRVSVKGPLGVLTRAIDPGITVSVSNGQVAVGRTSDVRQQRALHGLVRSDIRNMIEGVTTGYERVLEISGVGFKAGLAGRALNLSLGFTHPVIYRLPDGIEAKVDKQTIVTIRGIDKLLVGQTAADLRAIRPPDVYKAKGIKYAGEVLIRKEGKTGK